jgi:hypothetical protein
VPGGGADGNARAAAMIGSVRHACLAVPDGERLRPLSFFANPSTGFPVFLPPMIVIVPCGPRPVQI